MSELVQTGAVLFLRQISFWRQAQAAVPVLALRSAEQLEGLEGIIAVFDLRQVLFSQQVDERRQAVWNLVVVFWRQLPYEGSYLQANLINIECRVC